MEHLFETLADVHTRFNDSGKRKPLFYFASINISPIQRAIMNWRWVLHLKLPPSASNIFFIRSLSTNNASTTIQSYSHWPRNVPSYFNNTSRILFIPIIRISVETGSHLYCETSYTIDLISLMWFEYKQRTEVGGKTKERKRERERERERRKYDKERDEVKKRWPRASTSQALISHGSKVRLME